MAPHPSLSQIEALVEFLEQNPGIAKGLLRTSSAKVETKRKWAAIATTLNSLGGAIKDARGWAKYWAEKKCALKKAYAASGASMRRTGGGPADNLPTLSDLDLKLIAVMGVQEFATGNSLCINPFPGAVSTWRDKKRRAREDSAKISTTHSRITSQASAVLGITGHASATELEAKEEAGISQGETTDENTALSSHATPQQKTKSHFQKVRTRCVALIVNHGHPAELLDDLAFRDILNLIPMSKIERSKLTSKAIKEYIETTNADDTGDAGSNNESFLGDDYDKGDDDIETANTSKKHKVKNESAECNCPSRDEGTHEAGCRTIAQETYWQYFEVSIDDAACRLCNKVINWTTMADLKVHMNLKHPSIEFKDDDEEFTADHEKQQSEGGGSIPDHTMEEVYLQEDLFDQSRAQVPSTAKKRKYPSNTFVTLNDSEKICIERFKSLDRFGLYVASLLKLLPADKSFKYQEQIVQRLIREQAAAG